MTDYWLKECPACGEIIPKLIDICPHCDADVRPRCVACGLPLCGDPPCCSILDDECRRARGMLTLEEGAACTPPTAKANRPEGGRGHGWLLWRRAEIGY